MGHLRATVAGLSATSSEQFCIRLWLELTIVGRAIWSDANLSQSEQLNALKWLNEIQHRVWGAHAAPHPDRLMHLLDQVIKHAEHAPGLKPHLRVALDRALAVVTSV